MLIILLTGLETGPSFVY